jgi:hypothetical protein
MAVVVFLTILVLLWPVSAGPIDSIFTMTARCSYTANIGVPLRRDLFRAGVLVVALQEFRA